MIRIFWILILITWPLPRECECFTRLRLRNFFDLPVYIKQIWWRYKTISKYHGMNILMNWLRRSIQYTYSTFSVFSILFQFHWENGSNINKVVRKKMSEIDLLFGFQFENIWTRKMNNNNNDNYSGSLWFHLQFL